jgi:hypothetical protein
MITGTYAIARLLADEAPVTRLTERMPRRGGREVLNESVAV